MEIKLEITSPADVAMLAGFDSPINCAICRPSQVQLAMRNLTSLAEWWLAPAQQAAWRVRTLILGKQTRAKSSLDAVFKISHPSRPNPLPIFLVLCQHYESKNYPHYQLQVPTGDITKINNDVLVRAIKPLSAQCDGELKHFRYDDSKSIPFETTFPPADWNKIQTSIANYVVGVRKLLDAQGT